MTLMLRVTRFLIVAAALTAAAIPATAENMRTFFLPGPVALPADKMPVDILAAVLAAERAAKGESDLSGGLKLAVLAPGAAVARDVFGVPPVPMDFTVDQVNLISVVPSEHFDHGQKIFGEIEFAQRVGLRIRVAFMVDYVAAASGITIDDLALLTVTPADHRVAVFVLSQADARQLVEDATMSYPDVIAFVTKRGRPLPLKEHAGDAILVALSLDRMLAGDRLELSLAAGGATSASPSNMTFNRQGFAVTMLPVPKPTAGKVTLVRHTDMHGPKDDGAREIGSLSLLAPPAPSTAAPSAAPGPQRTEKAFGVELRVPAQWSRQEYHVQPDDHEEVQFAEKLPDVSNGAWFSVFPNASELYDSSLTEQQIFIDGLPAKRTEQTLGENDPPPRHLRRQVVVYFEDKKRPAFLFDGDEDKWPALSEALSTILNSIRLPRKNG